ncbi:hypothetical protein ACNOYE_27275 [Nannocystaceae bacterium ST9]
MDCFLDLTQTSEGPPNPVQIPYVTIEMADQTVPLVGDCENEDGWAWSVEGELLTFCGSWYELVKQGTA